MFSDLSGHPGPIADYAYDPVNAGRDTAQEELGDLTNNPIRPVSTEAKIVTSTSGLVLSLPSASMNIMPASAITMIAISPTVRARHNQPTS